MRIPLLIFLITLLPLGFGHTLYGTMAIILLALVIGLSLAIGLMLVKFSEYGTRPWFARLSQYAARLLFHSRPRLFLLTTSCVFFTEALALSYFTQGCVPTIQDSVAQLIGAKMLLMGQVALPAYPIGEFFDLGVMVNDGRYYMQYPPGHTLLLALGLLLGAPCAVNPLLGALTVAAVYALAKELYGAFAARIAALLMLVSPFILIMSAEYMNHATTLLLATLFLLAFIRAWRASSKQWALAAGLAIGMVLVTRPLTAVGIGLPAACAMLAWLLRDPRRALTLGMVMLLGMAPMLAFLGWYNLQTTGEYFTLGYQKLITNRYGFGPVPTPMLTWVSQREHTLWHGIGMAFNNLNALHWFVFNWPVSSLLFVPMAFLGRKMLRAEKLLLASGLSLLLVHVPYYFQNWAPGPRFLYEALGIVIIFTAFGITRTPLLLAHVRRITQEAAQARLAFFLAGCILFSIGFTLWGLSTVDAGQDKRAAIARVEALQEPTLLFVPFGEEYWRLAGRFYPVTKESAIIIAKDAGVLNNARLMKLYPNHRAVKAEHVGLENERWEVLR